MTLMTGCRTGFIAATGIVLVILVFDPGDIVKALVFWVMVTALYVFSMAHLIDVCALICWKIWNAYGEEACSLEEMKEAMQQEEQREQQEGQEDRR
jgi:hypothetical protein